ncbi:unnamed protein product [Pleuronectes platessa]|uniref:Protein GOLM2 n=1 Tax=Pleuronectes platessa TaxID=8262 RepID=A0A9N7YRY3_PLEPL|nr:unnamed protein product [Pleuronectes platessa]
MLVANTKPQCHGAASLSTSLLPCVTLPAELGHVPAGVYPPLTQDGAAGYAQCAEGGRRTDVLDTGRVARSLGSGGCGNDTGLRYRVFSVGMVGFGANRRGGRLPSFILIFLMVIIGVLSFNYWTVSSKHGRLLDELAEVQTQVKRTDAARSRLEKRNTELMVQVEAHRKQIDQKDGDYSVMEGKLQAREALLKKCENEKMRLQSEVTSQITEIQRLEEQLKELKQEFIKQEEQLREVKKNSTTLERKLEYESLQCGRQIAQLKNEYEESKKTLEQEALKLRQSVIISQKGVLAGRHAEGAPGAEMVGERHTVATNQHDSDDLKEEMGKPGSDAGMPGIEDSEVGKIDDVQFALKKPAVPKKHEEAPDAVVGRRCRTWRWSS